MGATGIAEVGGASGGRHTECACYVEASYEIPREFSSPGQRPLQFIAGAARGGQIIVPSTAALCNDGQRDTGRSASDLLRIGSLTRDNVGPDGGREYRAASAALC